MLSSTSSIYTRPENRTTRDFCGLALFCMSSQTADMQKRDGVNGAIQSIPAVVGTPDG
jgi:hypothetical protein